MADSELMFTFEADISIRRTLLSCTNSIHFIEIPLWLLKDTLQVYKLRGTG